MPERSGRAVRTGVRVAVTPSSPERTPHMLDALFAAGAEAIHEDGASLVTHCANAGCVEDLRRASLAVDHARHFETAPAPDVDWSLAWRDRVTAQSAGRFTVCPPWLADQFVPEMRIVIDPAMAFGTGEHATTRGVLVLLGQHVRAGDRVADLGAGSAVLSIAAAKSGAARVAAIELDADAIANAEANVVANDVADRVTVIEGDAAIVLPLIAPVRVVLANIVSSVIAELLPVIRDSLTADGVAIFSGMLTSERDAMRVRFADAGWRELADVADGEWWTVCVGR